ncbi:uncharacterized protein LOC112019319 [Quercus suber]|uniref:uncharacterized protein LOC112019319 n=1 Tax=Quercus suber TaxID=58331 RepID=UPI000CE19334|nr:uncharacterized protein LOC112019319 [Quercus suber]
MPPLFYQHFWSLSSECVTKAILDFLNCGVIPPKFNETHIVLIPKVKNPTTVSQYRPISLSNVISRLASKVLANRLKRFLPDIISENQSAFMSTRLITDNVLVAFETMHYLNHKKSGRQGEMALKLDMSKVFDRVEWGCLRNIMLKMGFSERWVNIMMLCVTSVTYSIRLNGKPRGLITPTRGLRQGDPISPFLFLFCAEGLSALLNKAARNGEITGVAACPHGPRISHLFFADDSIIFCQATSEECTRLENILETYEHASGQKLNKEKTSLFFSHNTSQDIRDNIKHRFGAEVIKQHETYLGLPSLVGRSKKNTFRALKERLDHKLSGWKEKLLSQAGKEVLIKAVAQAVPTYTMSVFKLPDTLCDELTSMVRSFWWGQSNGRTKMAWLSWEKMCAPKKEGGLGFRDLKSFNLALLSKQGWRLQTNTCSLVYRVLKARYFPNCDFLHAKLGRQPSFAWRSILAAQHIVQAGHRWQVGNGASIRVWQDRWIPRPPSFTTITQPNTLHMHSMVAALLDEVTGEWKADLVKRVFLPEEAQTILSIPRSNKHANDRIIWAYTPKGIFTVNSAYKVALATSPSASIVGQSDTTAKETFWRTLWSLNIPNKIKNFAWRACRNILPTKVNLRHRGVLESATCEACGVADETSGHLFWECTKAREVWLATGIPFDTQGVYYRDFIDLIWYLIFVKHAGRELLELILSVAWCMWYNRNKTRLGSTRQTSQQVIHKARSLLEEFQQAHLSRPHFKDQADTRWSLPYIPGTKSTQTLQYFRISKPSGLASLSVIMKDL